MNTPQTLTLHAGFVSAYPRREAQAAAADAANDAALSATILQALAPAPRASLGQMVAKVLAAGGVEPTEVADLIEEIEARLDKRFATLDDSAENQPLIDTLYELGEALEQARLRVVKLDALCEGVKL